jgi:ribosomal protein S12
MLLRTGTESAARKLQGASSHFPKIRLFTQRLVRAYISFDKASEQIHSVLYAFGHRYGRKVARLFQGVFD